METTMSMRKKNTICHRTERDLLGSGRRGCAALCAVWRCASCSCGRGCSRGSDWRPCACRCRRPTRRRRACPAASASPWSARRAFRLCLAGSGAVRSAVTDKKSAVHFNAYIFAHKHVDMLISIYNTWRKWAWGKHEGAIHSP